MLMNQNEITFSTVYHIIKKYAVVLIIYELIIRFGIGYITGFILKIFPIQNPSTNLNELNYQLTIGIIVCSNILAGLFILWDLNMRLMLSWMLVLLAFLAPWVGAVFVITWKLAEMKNSA
jgi:hypothetical protein